MAEFAKKGVMGYKVLPGGRNDSESTHAILSLEEYDELLRRIAVAERDKHEAIAQAKRTIGRALTQICCGFHGSGRMPTGASGPRRSIPGMRWFAPWRRSTAIR